MHRKLRIFALGSALCMTLSGSSVLLAQDNSMPAQDAQQQGAPGQGQWTHGGQGGAMMSPDRQLDRLTKVLKLTPDQQAQIKPILENRQSQMMQIRQDSSIARPDKMAKLRALNDDSDSKIQSVLTDEQKPRYQEMLQHQQQRRDQMREQRQGGGAPPDAGDQAPPPPSGQPQ